MEPLAISLPDALVERIAERAAHLARQKPAVEQRYLNREEAAVYMGVSVPFLEKHREIPYAKLPGSSLVFYDRREIDAYVAAHRSGG